MVSELSVVARDGEWVMGEGEIVSTIPVIWCYGNRGDRCHGLLESLFAGDLAPTCHTFTHKLGFANTDPDTPGAVVVISGGAQRDYAEQIASEVNNLAWSLIIILADEQSEFDWRTVNGPNRKIWRQMPCGDKTAGVHRYLPIGYPAGTRELLRTVLPAQPEAARRYPWLFIGQMQHKQRQACVETLGARKDGGKVVRTAGFYQGFSRAEYLKYLLDSYLAPSPAGMYTVDCFRTWEALECGCLPVVDRKMYWQPNGYDYWADVFGAGQCPLPVVENWSHFHDVADRYAEDVELRKADTNTAVAWWINFKRGLVVNLEADIRELTSGAPSAAGQPFSSLSVDALVYLPAVPPFETCVDTVNELLRHSAPESVRLLLHPVDHELNRQLLLSCNWNPDWLNVVPVVGNLE